MSESLFINYNGKLTDLFNPRDNFTFLVGAGISMDAPTNMPSAKQIVKTLLDLCAPSEEVNTLLSLKQLRYELIVEKIQDFFDAELKFMDYIEIVKEPNLTHYFLAYSLLRGSCVATTNFDYLIENALLRILDKKWHDDIIPVITKEDFLEFNNPKYLVKEGKYPIYKIHGSKRNIIRNKDTKESLITTISALGKGKEEGQTFAIEPYKKKSISNLMSDRTLIIMGYSGSDDFDIGPTLKELPELKNLIWIEHSGNEIIEIDEVKKYQDSKDLEEFTQSERSLAEIKKNSKFNVYRIKANTKTLLKDLLWEHLLPNDKIFQPKSVNSEIKIPNFSEWVKPLYEEINILDKYRFATVIYYYLKQIEHTERVAQKGLQLAKDQWNASLKSKFLNFLGLVSQVRGEYNNALNFYEQGLEIDEKLKDYSGMSSALSNIGTIHLTLGNYEIAQSKFLENLDIIESLGDYNGKITAYNNIGRLDEVRYKYNSSIENYNKALRLAEKYGDLGRKAAILNNIGRVSADLQQYDKAFSLYQEAIKIAKKLGDLYGEIILLNNIGRIYDEQKKYEDALVLYNQAIELARELGDYSKIAGCLNNIGSVNLAKGNMEQALKNYKEALALEEKLGDPLMQLIYLNNIGMIHASRDENSIAFMNYEKALQLAENIGDRSKSALLQTKIGMIYTSKNDLANALSKYHLALNLYDELNDLPNKAATLNNIARIHLSLEQYEKAEDFFILTLKLDSQSGENMNVASDLLSLAKLHALQENHEKSLDFYKQARDIFNSLGQDQYVNELNIIIEGLEEKL
ncbi:MAG: tetratricopeptide repeat protein [Promethearchaeota archaeon]